MRRALLLLSAGLVVSGPVVVGYRLSQGDRAHAGTPVTLLDEVREALAERYYRPVPPQVLRLDSVDAMLAALRDPYTTYLAPQDYRLISRETASSFSGIGVGVLPSARGLEVVAVEPGPARASGIRVGDAIVGIDGRSARGIGIAQAIVRVGGPPGTVVRLALVRRGRELELTVRRGIVRAPAVESRLLSYGGGRWGDIRLSSFRAGAAQVVARAVRTLTAQGAQGFVLDLRGNPGGLLSQAIAVSSLFLDGGVVATLDGAHKLHEVYRAHPGSFTRLPLVVLVDRYTASSAEIVAAALRDHDRATVVGERTYGKGVVEWIDPLGNGGALMVTVARYYTPRGYDLSHVGVRPQLRVVDDARTPEDEALAAALRTLARPAS